jgi:hypothetical protein
MKAALRPGDAVFANVEKVVSPEIEGFIAVRVVRAPLSAGIIMERIAYMQRAE